MYQVGLAPSKSNNNNHRPSIAVATSGGPDSMALTALLYRWCHRYDRSLHIFTIDHQLQDGSHQVARDTVARLASVLQPTCSSSQVTDHDSTASRHYEHEVIEANWVQKPARARKMELARKLVCRDGSALSHTFAWSFD